jgi:transcriptional regulator with XRE-family HTH domain
MDAVRVGLSIRAVRRKRNWTQGELGRRSDCSASVISRIERGSIRACTWRRLERITDALGARLYVRVLWQGEELDRLLDRVHATMVDRLLRDLSQFGWVTTPEATFQIAGKRGSVDILAWHPPSGVLLVIEIKSVVPDIQGTLSGIHRKARLAPMLAGERGWPITAVGRLLVLPNDRTARRRVEAHAATFDRALPARTAEVKRWLAAPSGSLGGVLFLSDLPPAQARHRVLGRERPATHESGVRR